MLGPRRTLLAVSALACVMMFVGSGCTYMGNRGRDFGYILDIGITTSAKPQLSLYGNFLNLATVGYSDFDGTLWGLGSRNVGMVQACHQGGGLVLWGYEQIGHAPADVEAPQYPRPYRVGMASIGAGIAAAHAEGEDVSVPVPPDRKSVV